MSYAVNTLVDYETPFAIRGGGHMPISNAANINSSGVLLSSSGLNQLILAPDQSTIEIGTGNIWSNVYEYLAPYQLGVVGGRAGRSGSLSIFNNLTLLGRPRWCARIHSWRRHLCLWQRVRVGIRKRGSV